MTRTRVAVLLSGQGTNMAALVYATRATDCPYDVVLVASDRPEAPGLALARAEAVPVVDLPAARAEPSAFFEALDAALTQADVDTVALAGFMRLLPPEFVERWAGRIVNIHPSLLPAHKGLGTHAAVIAAGETVTGCSVHIVTTLLDDGPVLAQCPVAVMAGDSAATLAARVLIAEHQLYPRALATYVGRHRDAAWIEARIDALASGFAEVARKTSHGAPGWAVGGDKTAKLFAIIADRHHGTDAVGLLVKSSGTDEMTGLIEADPERYYWPKYYGASGWIGIRVDRPDLDWDQVAGWLERSWRAAAPRRLTRLIDGAENF